MKAFVMKRIGEVGFLEKPVPSDPGETSSTLTGLSKEASSGGSLRK